MARADIRIVLQGGEEEEGLRRYEPGEAMHGRVEVVPQAEVQCRHLFVRLRWHTEGKGDRDQAKVGEVDLFQGLLQAQRPYAFEFSLPLPKEPWSYAGHYVNIVWEVEVELDVPWAVNPRHRQPFILAPHTP